MAFDTIITDFAEFVGGEVKRVENKIPIDTNGNPIILTGAGRPDKPETTRFIVPSQDSLDTFENKIKGNEPNGTVYISTNGAGVGAWKWIKANDKWEVVYADTGDITLNAVNVVKGNWVRIRRYNNLVIMSVGGGQWGWFQVLGKGSQGFTQRKINSKNMDIINVNGIPTGFRANSSILKPFYNDNGIDLGKVYVGSKNDYNYVEMRFSEDIRDSDYTDLRFPDLMWHTSEPFPESL